VSTPGYLTPPVPLACPLCPKYLNLAGYWTVRGFAITTDEPDDPMDSVVTDAEEGYKKMKEKVAKRGSNEEVRLSDGLSEATAKGLYRLPTFYSSLRSSPPLLTAAHRR